MQNLKNWWDTMWLVVLLSTFAGFANVAKKKETSPWAWFCGAIVAVFSGIIVHMLLLELTSVTNNLRVALASLAAYSGGSVLELCYARLAAVLESLIGHNVKK